MGRQRTSKMELNPKLSASRRNVDAYEYVALYSEESRGGEY